MHNLLSFVQRTGRSLLFIAGVIGTGLVGAIALMGSHAATPALSSEVEQGSLAGCVSSVSDATASDGQAIQLGSCNMTPLGLDASGATVPDTNYAIPGGAIYMATAGSDNNIGTVMAPVATINKAVALVPSGGTIVVRAGDYRQWYNNGAGGFKINTKPFTIQAYPHEQVWFDGADVRPTANWTSDGAGHWYTTWSTPSFCSGDYYKLAYANQTAAGPCTHVDQYGTDASSYPAAGDPQMVFNNGERVPEVSSLAAVTSGSFFYQQDLANSTGKIYIGFNPSGQTVELAARSTWMVNGAANMTFRGLGFKRYATNEYTGGNTDGAIYVGGGGNDTIENDTFTQMAGQALYVNPAHAVISSSVFAFNGFNGLGGNGQSSIPTSDSTLLDSEIIENSVFNNNNLEKFGLVCNASCAAAGIKLAHIDGYTVKDNIIENTLGNGHAGTGTGFWCDTDCNHGVFIHNLVKNNAGDGYAYEVDDAGIVASNLFLGNHVGISGNDTNTKIYNNTIVGSSMFALRLYSDARRAPGGNTVYNNVISGKSTNVMYVAKEGAGTVNASDNVTGFDYNSFWEPSPCPSGCTLYRWVDGTDGNYTTTAAFRAAHTAYQASGKEYFGGSDPFFVDQANGNYIIRTNSDAYRSGVALPADVAAALGLATSTVMSRGALSWPGSN